MLRLALLATLALPASAFAFCGFYVGGADSSLFNDATMVVMMREGTTTVLSMQNDYSGPPEGFALVVPVPEILEEGNVRTLPKSIFERVDQLAAPRLVEYWEQDPCYRPPPMRYRSGGGRRRMRRAPSMAARPEADLGVTVEAEFAVGEYDIVILSAEDSGGLETWLHREQYNIPEGARRVLSPYVQLGTKFFVAKVDPERVTFEDGHVVLSPLRVHYSADTFSLPVRLGLLNSRGQQDLIVHVLAKQQRYEVANYPNVMVPTNLVVDDETRNHFGAFYNSLFDRVLTDNPNAVVTEYSWRATSCDPCPTTPLQPTELALLGADVIDGTEAPPMDQPGKPARRIARPQFFGQGGPYTLTRLHYRYGPNDLERDLVFREAPAIIGGRGMPNAEGELQEKHGAMQQGGDQQLPGSLRDPAPLGRRDRLQQPDSRTMGWTARRCSAHAATGARSLARRVGASHRGGSQRERERRRPPVPGHHGDPRVGPLVGRAPRPGAGSRARAAGRSAAGGRDHRAELGRLRELRSGRSRQRTRVRRVPGVVDASTPLAADDSLQNTQQVLAEDRAHRKLATLELFAQRSQIADVLHPDRELGNSVEIRA